MSGFMTVDDTAYMPLQNFTASDLGCERSNAAYTNILKLSGSPESRQLLQTFEDVWNDPDRLQDVTDTVADSIAAVYQENAPEFIYFYTLYNIFSEFLEDLSEDVLPNEATGFRASAIWNTLYNFQKDAALAIINKLENTTAAFSRTASASARPLPRWPSSNTTRTGINPYSYSARKNSPKTGTPTRATTKTIPSLPTASAMTYSSTQTSPARTARRTASTSPA